MLWFYPFVFNGIDWTPCIRKSIWQVHAGQRYTCERPIWQDRRAWSGRKPQMLKQDSISFSYKVLNTTSWTKYYNIRWAWSMGGNCITFDIWLVNIEMSISFFLRLVCLLHEIPDFLVGCIVESKISLSSGSLLITLRLRNFASLIFNNEHFWILLHVHVCTNSSNAGFIGSIHPHTQKLLLSPHPCCTDYEPVANTMIF